MLLFVYLTVCIYDARMCEVAVGLEDRMVTSGGFRGGDGGCIPPHQPKHNVHIIVLNIKKKAISEYSISRVTAI